MSWRELVEAAVAKDSASVAARWAEGSERSWARDAEQGAIESMSVTKFVVGSVLGLAVGVADLERPLETWIDEWKGEERGSIQLRHVTTHTSGLEVLPPQAVYEAESIASLVLAAEPSSPPGRFAYNNSAIHLLAIMVERATGHRLHDLAGEKLFTPLGITEWTWQCDSEGFPMCHAGLHLTAADLARIGSVYLTSGTFEGRQVLDSAWVERTAPQGEIGLCCFADYAWIERSDEGVKAGPRTGFGHTGDYGQHLTIQPSIGVAAVRQRTTHDRDDDALWSDFAGAVASELAEASREWKSHSAQGAAVQRPA